MHLELSMLARRPIPSQTLIPDKIRRQVQVFDGLAHMIGQRPAEFIPGQIDGLEDHQRLKQLRRDVS